MGLYRKSLEEEMKVNGVNGVCDKKCALPTVANIVSGTSRSARLGICTDTLMRGCGVA
jgi:hypothetical protein